MMWSLSRFLRGDHSLLCSGGLLYPGKRKPKGAMGAPRWAMGTPLRIYKPPFLLGLPVWRKSPGKPAPDSHSHPVMFFAVAIPDPGYMSVPFALVMLFFRRMPPTRIDPTMPLPHILPSPHVTGRLPWEPEEDRWTEPGVS